MSFPSPSGNSSLSLAGLLQEFLSLKLQMNEMQDSHWKLEEKVRVLEETLKTHNIPLPKEENPLGQTNSPASPAPRPPPPVMKSEEKFPLDQHFDFLSSLCIDPFLPPLPSSSLLSSFNSLIRDKFHSSDEEFAGLYEILHFPLSEWKSMIPQEVYQEKFSQDNEETRHLLSSFHSTGVYVCVIHFRSFIDTRRENFLLTAAPRENQAKSLAIPFALKQLSNHRDSIPLVIFRPFPALEENYGNFVNLANFLTKAIKTGKLQEKLTENSPNKKIQISLLINNKIVGSGEGNSIREAREAAACQILSRIHKAIDAIAEGGEKFVNALRSYLAGLEGPGSSAGPKNVQ